MMKKYVYLLTSCLLFSQAVQAGKYFDSFKDENGNQAILFKKSGHKFNGALNHVLNHVKSHKIQQIYFHQNVSEDQKEEVIALLSKRLNVVDIGNGLLEDADTYKVMTNYLNEKKSLGLVFKEVVGLDLRKVDPKIQAKYLPLAHKIVEGMDKVKSLYFTLSDFNRELLDPLKMTLVHNPGINRIFFDEDSQNILFTNIKKIMPELLFMPGEKVYYFGLNSLSQLSTGFLDHALNGVKVPELQKYSGKKAVVSLVSHYIGDRYDTSKMQNYKEVCQSDKYHSIFKASYVDYVNEREQGTLLLEMLNGGIPIETQLDKIDEVLRKDKALPLYFNEFKEIQSILTTQLSGNNDQALEKKKLVLINAVLTRMGRDEISKNK